MGSRVPAKCAWAALLGAAALWGPLVWRWARAWTVLPDQAYGWGVVPLAAYLFAERWRRAGTPRAGRPLAGAWLMAAGLALWAADLPVLEANAMWPTAQWWGAAGAALAALGALARVGGFAWAAQFAFAPLFLLTALTWPTPIKTWIVEHLSGANARLAAELVSAAGHPAMVSGNVIVVSTGRVGIEEACSGMRSLQAVWMVAWFAGEFFLLNWPRRLFLVAASLTAAVIANLARTTFLTWIAAGAGLDAAERWHDRAGNAELALSLLVVAGMAWRSRRPARARGAARGRAEAPSGAARRGSGPEAPASPPVSDSAAGARAWKPLRSAALATILVALAAEGATQAWYGSHEERAGAAPTRWRLAEPPSGWAPVAVPPRETEVLQSTGAGGLAWRPPAAAFPAWVFLVTWEGDAARSENPEWHDPAICLPAAGARLVATLSPARVAVAGRMLSFAGYRFVADGRPLTVYFCHWDAETARAREELPASADDVRARRWQRVEEGRREGDVAHIAFVAETGDAAAALGWVRRWAPVLLRPESG